jgi:hypothetical protein
VSWTACLSPAFRLFDWPPRAVVRGGLLRHAGSARTGRPHATLRGEFAGQLAPPHGGRHLPLHGRIGSDATSGCLRRVSEASTGEPTGTAVSVPSLKLVLGGPPSSGDACPANGADSRWESADAAARVRGPPRDSEPRLTGSWIVDPGVPGSGSGAPAPQCATHGSAARMGNKSPARVFMVRGRRARVGPRRGRGRMARESRKTLVSRPRNAAAPTTTRQRE